MSTTLAAPSRLRALPWLVGAVAAAFLVKNAAIALVLGCALGLVFGNGSRSHTGAWARQFLQAAVVLLGFGLQLSVVLRVGSASILMTAVTISVTLLLGWWIGRLLHIDRILTLLLSGGTAICGGSAIAALAPALRASPAQTAVAMAVVFLLNGVGLLVFPPLGHLLGMSEPQFGLWSALAIHDTSSVIGATAAYGAVALSVGTVVKLTRALWILPLALLAARLERSKGAAKIPWFLAGFVAAALLRTVLPGMEGAWMGLAAAGKGLVVVVLFLIGCGLSRADLARTGGAPLLGAVVLWMLVSVLSLAGVLTGWIHVSVPG